jgi:Mg-chelatase subunit ChlD
MSQAIDHLSRNWFAGLLVLAALGVGGVLVLRQRQRGTWSVPLLVLAAALALLGTGGLAVPAAWGWWLAGGGIVCLFGMLLVLILTGKWYAPVAAGLGVVTLLGVGGVVGEPIGDGLGAAGRFVGNLRPMQPWWLVLLGLIPVIVLLSFQSLAGLGPVRRWVAIGLRCALVLFLTLALAEASSTTVPDTTTVIFAVDRSLSVPDELQARLEKFLNWAVEERGSGRERYKTGVILFARRPRLERAPSDVSRLNFEFKKSSLNIDGNYTDIGAAIKQAVASFPEDTGKRVVLLSDGNENLGNAEEQARLAKRNGVQIDVIPLAAGRRIENEVLVERVEAPAFIEQGSHLRIRVFIRSMNPNVVRGELKLSRVVTDPEANAPVDRRWPIVQTVDLNPGLNTFTFEPPGSQPQGSYSYQAEFRPELVLGPRGNKLADGLPGDRVQNNRATTHVVARGQGRVLVLAARGEDIKFLRERLPEGEGRKFQLDVRPPDALPRGKEDLGVFLSNFDCVVLVNVPADAFTEAQQEMLRSNTYDQGCGLVMVGGPESFGAGGWQNTPVERALPVDTDIKSFKVQGKVGLVMIMHASEMAKGNYWQKQIAKLAIAELSSTDEVGILHFDFGGMKWHIPLQEVGDDRAALMAKVDTLTPGDMPDFDPGLRMAYEALMEPKRALMGRHVIIISDGDPAQNDRDILAKCRKAKITVSTVGVATHGAAQDQHMLTIAQQTRGRFYNVKNAALLPSIYLKETRLISQQFVYESNKPLQLPEISRRGPTEGLPRQVAGVYGFVRTTLKPSVLVEASIMTPEIGGQAFPVLAYWHYGLGKAVAFTSDACAGSDRKFWTQHWAEREYYGKFWEQVIDWALRPVESKRLVMTTEYRDGEVRITVDARDDKNQPRTDLLLRGGVTVPGDKADTPDIKLKFEQKSSGVYEAKFRAEESGSYFINAAAVRKVKKGDQEVEEVLDSVRAGVTIPYSPEFSDLESNTTLLQKLATLTDGKYHGGRPEQDEHADDEAVLRELARSGELFRPGPMQVKSLQPLWFWLVLLTGLLLLLDVGVRRIALDPAQGVAAAGRLWDRLRGRAEAAVQTPEFLERLKSRKAQVGESLDKAKAARRFEGPAVPVSAPPPGAADLPPPRRPEPRPAPAQGVGPEAPKEADDYASRLLKAKRRIQREREKPSE